MITAKEARHMLPKCVRYAKEYRLAGLYGEIEKLAARGFDYILINWNLSSFDIEELRYFGYIVESLSCDSDSRPLLKISW